MTPDEIIELMVRTIDIERETSREAMRTGRYGKNRFILSGLTGEQLEAVQEFLVSFKTVRLSAARRLDRTGRPER